MKSPDMSLLPVRNHAPRVLYLPNEGDFREGHGQVGGRVAFAEMERTGLIGELRVYSFLADYYAKAKNREASYRALLEQVRAFQPEILFWQHPIGYPIRRDLLREIRSCGSSPLIAYHEGDPFDCYYKRMPREVVTLYKDCDVFLTIGLGDARRLFSKLRVHPHFYYSSHTFDLERFGEPPVKEAIASKYDAVMIGTIASWKWGIHRQRYAGQRIRLGRALAKLLGSRFAAFGNGWPANANGQGPIPYNEQVKTIQTSRMSVIWDLYPDYTFYYSDRLPIALASGIPFVTNNRNGLDILLKECPGVYLANSIEDILDIVIYLRSLDLDEIASIGAAGRAWAIANIEARMVFRKAFETCLRIWRSRR